MKKLIILIALITMSIPAFSQQTPEQKIDLMISQRKTGNKIIAIGLGVSLAGAATYYFADKNKNKGVRNAGVAILAGGIAVTLTGIVKK